MYTPGRGNSGKLQRPGSKYYVSPRENEQTENRKHAVERQIAMHKRTAMKRVEKQTYSTEDY